MTPLFSVIVPTRERPAQLRNCLGALAALDYPRDRFEVVVVDDGSREPPESLVRAFDGHLEVTLLAGPRRGPAGARNAGARQAKGDYLAFTDDDCLPQPDWLQAFERRFAPGSVAAVGGVTVNLLRSNTCSVASQLLLDYLGAYYNAVPDEASFFTSSNLAVLAPEFRRVGGFDPSFRFAGGEDRELAHRLARTGGRPVFAPEVVVCHAHALTLRSFLRQHFAYGRGAFRFHQAKTGQRFPGVRPEPARFYVDLVARPLSGRTEPERLQLAGLLAVSQLANAAGFGYEAVRGAGRSGPAR